jgi:hypothetical protein
MRILQRTQHPTEEKFSLFSHHYSLFNRADYYRHTAPKKAMKIADDL